MKRLTRTTALTAAALLLVACGVQAGRVTVNGATDLPVTLSAVSYNVTGRSGGDELAELTRLVSAGSHATVTLTPGPQPESGAPDTSADALALVRSGRVDVAVVSARTFDTLGVTSFQALQAPYLVRSLAQADAVLADPLADRMLAGVKPLGLVGIGLAFDFLAYPGGFGTPVLDVADYRGQQFQVRPSRAGDLLTQALGAQSDYRNGQEMEEAVASHDIRGTWDFFNGAGIVGGEIFTANAPAFLRANVIVVNAKVFSGLSDAQQQALRAAAAGTRDWMAARHQDPVAAAASFCASGWGDIARATPVQERGVEAAADSVVTWMEKDPFNRAAIARIRQLGSGLPRPAVPHPCSASVEAVPVPTLEAAGDQGVLDGVWRLEVEAEPLRAAGWSENDVANNVGTWTWTFHDGAYEYVESHGRVCQGNYTVNGHELLIVQDQPIGCDLVLPLVFLRSGDQLTFEPDPGRLTGVPLTGDQQGLMTPDAEGWAGPFFHQPLNRVGEAP